MIFIVQPSGYFPHDKVHQVCRTTHHDASEAYDVDNYELVDSFDNLDSALELSGELGDNSPTLI